MKRKKKKINAENAANNNVENKLRELGVELNTDATKLNNLSRLLSALISSSPPPGTHRAGGTFLPGTVYVFYTPARL